MIAFTDEYDTWIAKNLEDLKTLVVDEQKIIDAETFDDCEWQALSDDLELTIVLDPYQGDEVERHKETRTVKAWIEKQGRGFLCSTEF